MKKETRDKHFIKKPYYKGGNEALKKFVNENLKYPPKAFEKKTEGTVSVRYEIGHKGKVIDTKVIGSLSPECNEEAMRVVKLLKFVVPKSHKARVTFHKTIKIHFKMPKEQPKPAPQQVSQIQYQITPTKKTEIPQEKPKPSSGYSYTIRF